MARKFGTLVNMGKRLAVTGDAWRLMRRRQLHTDYRRRRDRYDSRAEELGLRYSEEAVWAAVRRRLRDRGYTPTRRALGEVHTFALLPGVGWHPALIPDLEQLGPLSSFDYYRELGITPKDLYKRDAKALGQRSLINDRAFAAIRLAHDERPIDWLFVYESGLELEPSLIQRTIDELGIPTVNMCLDDKQSWEGPWFGNQRLGQIDIAASFDISWTSARVACEWYLVEKARPIYLPEGFDASSYRPIDIKKDLDLSFVGGAYGFRPWIVRDLRRRGLDVAAFGDGWEREGVWGDAQVEVFNRSVVNIGLGGIGYSERLTNVKTRDFEIPGTGGGVYLTTYNSDLARHFVIGKEILCYQSVDELVEQARQCIAEPDEAAVIAINGRRRCLREHRWLHRYARICSILGILDKVDCPGTDSSAGAPSLPE